MEHQLLRYKNSDIAWYRFGSGPRVVLCFHGYGEDARNYAFMAKHTVDLFSFIAIDLPFHGQTNWTDGDFTPKDLQQIVEEILLKETLKPQTSNPKLSIIGFSLGGRMALRLYQDMHTEIGKLVLLAPDGLKVNRWYWLATQTWAGNRLFAFTMKKPAWFFSLLKLLNKLGWVNSSIFKFVNYYIGDANARRLLYTRWTTLKKITPHLPTIKKQIAATATPVRLLYGQHDRIILPSVGEKFRKGIEAQSTLRVIASGHQVLHEKHAKDIVEALLH